MDRDIDVQQRREQESPRPPIAESPAAAREPEPYALGPYRYRVSADQLETLAEVGRFRTVDIADLERFKYQGNSHHSSQDLGSLQAQGLMQTRTIFTGPKRQELVVAVLTKPGKALLEMAYSGGTRNPDQNFYSGLVKPAEIRHDAAIYRMFQAEKEHIERSGGRVRRIVLDYELKRSVYQPLAKAGAIGPAEYANEQDRVAQRNGLKVVGGKILLPDLRIEYENAAGASATVDLELATEHYRGGMMRGKAEAGFKLYASRESASGMAAAFDPELVAALFLF